MLSHNADAFGAPFCDCCDTVVCEGCDDDTEEALPTPSLYDFTHDKHNHYGQFSFKDLCHRAHVPAWEALGQREPRSWRFVCPCCGEVRHPASTARSSPSPSPNLPPVRSSTPQTAAAPSSMQRTRSSRTLTTCHARAGSSVTRKSISRSNCGAHRCCRSTLWSSTRCTASTTRPTC